VTERVSAPETVTATDGATVSVVGYGYRFVCGYVCVNREGGAKKKMIALEIYL
jgi:hypothetical protein